MVFLHADSHRRQWLNNTFNTFFIIREGNWEEFLSEFFWSPTWIRTYLSPLIYSNTGQSKDQFSSVQLLSCVQLFVTPWIAACQASLSITNSWSSLKLMSIKSVMPSSHLILCRPLFLLPSIPPSIRVFFNEATLHIRWPKYWSFSFSISPSNEHPGLISFKIFSYDKV